MRTRLLLRIVLGIALVATPVLAAEITVGQKGQHFSEQNLSLKVGDSINFVNDDTVAHDVMSSGPDGIKNAGLQKTGESTSITYDKPGDYHVVCGIHPKMQIFVKVE
jgi:cytochrome c peroxidase